MTSYHDKNFSVIPLNERRISMQNNWSRFNRELPDEPLYKKGQRGIGLLPGPESGVMVVDIDTEDQNLIKTLQNILPSSPVQRFGSKGIALVYSYNHKLSSRKFRNIKVELFIDSGYVALPPSLHEKTGLTYKWVGKNELLEISKEDLPSFGESEMAELERLDEQYGRANPVELNSDGTIGRGGRHDTLLNQAFAGLHANKDHDTIARELVWYDLNKHSPPWFVEEMHAKSEEEMFEKAKRFVASAVKTFDKKNPPVKKNTKEAFKFIPYPKPDGFMKVVLMYLMPQFSEESYESCLTGAIALMSVLCGNRFSYQGVFSNAYIINLAETGSGKSFAMSKIIKGLLLPVARDLVGRGSYQSESSIWHEFITRKTFIDTLDEISSLFKKANDSQTTYSEILLKLWDDAATEWFPPTYSALNKEAAKLPKTIANPCLTIWGASTIKTFESVISETNYQTGLLPRALILIKEGHGEIQDSIEPSEDATRSMQGAIKQFLFDVPFVTKGMDLGAETGVVTKDIGLDKDANALVRKYQRDMQMRMQKTLDEASKGFMARYPQHLRKLALIHSVSRCFGTPKESVVKIEDIEWAHAFIEAMIHNNSLFYARTSTKSGFERQKAQVFAYISQRPGVSKSELGRSNRMNGKVMEQIIQDLINAELVTTIADSAVGEKGGRPKLRYHPVLDS